MAHKKTYDKLVDARWLGEEYKAADGKVLIEINVKWQPVSWAYVFLFTEL